MLKWKLDTGCLGKDGLFLSQGSWLRKTLFKACDAERLGQQEREKRQPQHHSEDAAQLLSLALGSTLGVLC